MLLLAVSALTLGLTAVWWLLLRTKPLPVTGVEGIEMRVRGINIFPAICGMFRLMPEKMRKTAMTKQNAPKPDMVARDIYDVCGKSPYEFEELEKDKVWQVTYKVENMAMSAGNEKAKEEAKAFGIDPSSEDYKRKCLTAAALLGDRYVERVRKDLVLMEKQFSKTSMTDEELLESIEQNRLQMFVVRLESGGLLLYAPVRLREELVNWLDNLGPVQWIVVASSYHTLNIKYATDRYPVAKVIGVPASEDKLTFINALARGKLDYNVKNAAELRAVSSLLEKEGVKLFYVAGDVATNAILVVAHGILLECDLVYGHHDGFGFMQISGHRFKELRPEDFGLRLFRLAFMNRPNAPHGSLATYRYLMMDPAGLGAMNYDQPARDGSSCLEMATSLRKLLSLEFSSAAGVHIAPQSREDFRRNIDCNWNWLDGKSLL